MTVEKVKNRSAARAQVFVGQSEARRDREDIITQILEMVQRECGPIPELHDKLPEIEQMARRMFGGAKHYAATYRDRQALVAMIRHEYNGRNVQQLAVRYGVSRATVYRLVKT